MHPLSYFDKVFVINLPARADRRREMDQQLRKIGLAIDASLIEVFQAIRPPDKGPFSSVGARGAFLSHLGVLRTAAGAGYRRILILEDDVNFIEDFNTQFTRMVRSQEGQDWHLFYGGYQLLDEPAPPYGTPLIDPERGVMLAHFLGFATPAISMAVEFLETLLTRPPGDHSGGPMHVDGAYSCLRRLNPSLTTRLAVPQLGYQRASRTDIHELRWFDRLSGVRGLVGVARSLKNLATRR
jgi:glycosyl transferase, family 25